MQSKLQSTEPANSDFPELNPRFSFRSQNCEYLWSSCTKNPGHKSFIPVKEFQIQHLPPECREENVVDFIKATAELTVRIRAENVSGNRPEGDRFYSVRGKQFARTGSGSVTNVFCGSRTCACNCRDCTATSKRENVVATIVIHTARHVVFDESEVRGTIVDLFYDDDNSSENVKTLVGSNMLYSSQEYDECIFACSTHDSDLAEKLSRNLADLQRFHLAANRRLLGRGSRLAIVVSHPHGCFKHISIGEFRTAVSDSTEARRTAVSDSTEARRTAVSDSTEARRTAVVDSTSATTEVPSTKPRSVSGVHAVVDSDKVIFTICPVFQSVLHVGQSSLESESTGVEVTVELPDGRKTQRVICQMDSPVAETKKWLFSDCGITEPPELFDMVLELPEEDIQILKDEKNMEYYWDDLCMSLRLYFQVKAGQPQ